MKRIRENFASFLASSEGATAIEYGLIIALVALGALAGFTSFGEGLANMWAYISDEVLAVT